MCSLSSTKYCLPRSWNSRR